MLDIKGQQVNIGDKVLVSTKRHGLVLTTFSKETKGAFYFEDNCAERISKFVRGQYMGSQILNLAGQPYNSSVDGPYQYAPNNYTIKRLGDNGTYYKLQDISSDKQSRVLKVDDNFTL